MGWGLALRTRFSPRPPGGRDARSLMTTFRRRVAEWLPPSLKWATLRVPQVSGGSSARSGPVSRRPPQTSAEVGSARAPGIGPGLRVPRRAAPSRRLPARLTSLAQAGAGLTFLRAVGDRQPGTPRRALWGARGWVSA